MLTLCQSCFIHITPMQLTLNFVLFQATHPQCALSQPQIHHSTCVRVFHAAFKPFQVLLHPSSLESTCLTHTVLFPQFLRQCHQAHLSSTPALPNHRVHALRALPACPAFPVPRNTRNSLFFSVSIMFPSCFGLCTNSQITTHVPSQRNMTACSALTMNHP